MEQSTPATTRRELRMARSMCWHCQSEVSGEYFCDQCVKVQPLSKELDYFTCLGLPRLLTIDTGLLERKFYEMSRVFHPDFYQTKTDAEREISLRNSALLNAAYRTVRDPIKRADYLVSLEAGAVKEIRTSPPADLFEEILALQEDLEEFRSARAEGDDIRGEELRQKLAVARQALEQRQREMEGQLFRLFEAWDAVQRQRTEMDEAAYRTRKAALLQEIRAILSNRTYLINIVDELVGMTE